MKSRWTLREMLFVVTIVALGLPYLLALVPNPITRFSFSESELDKWVRQIDPASRASSSGFSTGDPVSLESDCEYVVTMKSATPDELYSHIRDSFGEKIKSGLWSVTQSTGSNDSFTYAFSKGLSRYRLHVSRVPLRSAEQELSETLGDSTMRIRILIIGYTAR